MSKYFSIVYLIVITSFYGCEDYLNTEINQDPNNPINVPITAILPSIQINLADVYGGEFSRISCMLVQQIQGTARGCVSNYTYAGLTPNRFNTVWSNVYENILNEIAIAQRIAVAKEYYHYLGILNIMEAYTLMIAADVWDNIPYSNALQGIENINPSYDDQNEIYIAIYDKLERAQILLDGESGGLTIGSDDQYYQGNIQNWQKTTSAIQARALLHEGKYNEALAAANASYNSSHENMGYQYPDKNAAGPWFRFNQNRTGDISFGSTLKNLMHSLNDTSRLNVLAQEFYVDHPYFKPIFFQELISYREIEFIKVECEYQLNNTLSQNGIESYLKGIKASFDRLGLLSEAYDDYIKQEAILPINSVINLEQIMTQKHIALFADHESYSDYRRTGYPEIFPTSGLKIPVRWEYPEDEYSFNSSAPAIGTIDIFNDKVGWNK